VRRLIFQPSRADPLKRQPSMAGSLFVCETCDKDDPIKAADKWLKGELKPPN
jgi:hypothetical protein